MQWSFPIGRFGGTEIRIHLTFLLLLAWIAIAHFQAEGGQAAIEATVFIVAVFACVLLHELGHAVAAMRYGIRTPKITLLPIGGVAQLERLPEKPREEIVVALAGPLVNVVIAAVLILVFKAGVAPATQIENPQPGFLARLAAVNISLVLFNLIPAFPMDGGRVLRALLATRYTRVRATEIAARIGQFAAFLFGFLGLVGGSPILVFVAVFVYLAAASEAQATGLTDIARNMSVRDAMITHFETLGPMSTLDDAAKALLRTTQHEFPVTDGGGRLRGVLTRNAMAKAIAERGMATPVLEVLETDLPEVRAESTLAEAVTALQNSGKPVVAVLDRDNRLVGYVTSENIGELMMLRSAAGS